MIKAIRRGHLVRIEVGSQTVVKDELVVVSPRKSYRLTRRCTLDWTN